MGQPAAREAGGWLSVGEASRRAAKSGRVWEFARGANSHTREVTTRHPCPRPFQGEDTDAADAVEAAGTKEIAHYACISASAKFQIIPGDGSGGIANDGHYRPNVASLLFAAPQTPLRRLGQPRQAARDPAARGTRPLPQLGFCRTRPAQPFSRSRCRPAWAWRFRLGDRRQLLDNRSRARRGPTGERARTQGAGGADRSFAWRGCRTAARGRLPRVGGSMRCNRGARAARGDDARD